MKKHLLVFALASFVLVQHATSQYYYRDIISNRQATAEKEALKTQNVKNILVHSFEGTGEPSEGFFCEKKISKDFRRIETYTRSYVTAKALLTSYYNENGWLERSTDSSDITVSNSFYEYDARGNVIRITSHSHSNDDDFTTTLKEVHQYIYNDKGQPLKMLRIRNDKDTTVVDFKLDENGNVTDEIETGKNGLHYYYYYDNNKRLTDIVKYNVVRKTLLPDFMFEYNTAGQVTQMVAIEEGVSNDYYTWKYVYNDGLRIIEKCFSKEKTLLGYFEYEYE